MHGLSDWERMPVMLDIVAESDSESETEPTNADMAGSSSSTTEASPLTYPAGTVAKLTNDILNDTFYNIIHDIVAKVHRDEKIARMRSAVVAARQKAEGEMARLRESDGANKVTKPGEAESGEKQETQIKVETDGAIFDAGKVYLKGNPLVTTKEIICPHCRLPRLLYPTTGAGARPPPNPYKEYCSKHPFIVKPGYDVNGNPFATDKPNSKKKKTNNTSTNTPASSPPSTPDASGSFSQAAPEKVSFPTVKCPNCTRYLVVTRVAQHLDRCMGFSGRGAGRNRTPQETTPVASAPPKRPLVDDDIALVSHKKKKPNTPKKLTGKKPTAPSKLKNGTTPDTMAASEAAESGDVSKAASDDGSIKVEANGD